MSPKSFEVRILLRGLILLLSIPLIIFSYLFISESLSIQILISISFAGLKIRDIELASCAVLPRFYVASAKPDKRKHVVVAGNSPAGGKAIPWVEKYWPQSLDDVAAHRDIVETNCCICVTSLQLSKIFARRSKFLPRGTKLVINSIDKVIVHDKESWCMKPDMKITLVFEVVEERPEQSAYMALLRYFNSRLIDFFNMHPECDGLFAKKMEETK